MTLGELTECYQAQLEMARSNPDSEELAELVAIAEEELTTEWCRLLLREIGV